MPYLYQSNPNMLVIEGELEIDLTLTAEENLKKLCLIAENIGAMVTRNKGDEDSFSITAYPPFSNSYYKLLAVKRPNGKMVIETVETWTLIELELDKQLPEEIRTPEAHQLLATLKELVPQHGGQIIYEQICHGGQIKIVPPNGDEVEILGIYEGKYPDTTLTVHGLVTFAKVNSQKFLRVKDFDRHEKNPRNRRVQPRAN